MLLREFRQLGLKDEPENPSTADTALILKFSYKILLTWSQNWFQTAEWLSQEVGIKGVGAGAGWGEGGLVYCERLESAESNSLL